MSRLFGSPPGYVGYEEGGQLTEKVRRKPFSVVLFDEVEKAHPDIFNSLLQILEDGRLTDAQGRVVDFKNTVIIMTTNLGTRDISKGFRPRASRTPATPTTGYDRMKSKVQDELKQHFRPEFLNRIDDIVVFHQLTQEEIVTIVDLMVAKLDERLRDKDMGVELTPAAKDLLAKKGYDPVLGARPLRRTIQREIEDPLSEKILFGELRPGQIVLVDTEGEGEEDDLHLRRRGEGGAARRAAGRGDRGHPGVAPAGTTTQGRRQDAVDSPGAAPRRTRPTPVVHDRSRPLIGTTPGLATASCSGTSRTIMYGGQGAAAGQGRDGTSEVAGDLGHGGHSREGHREVELGEQVLEHGAHAVGAGQRQAVDVGPAHADGRGPERQCGDDVGTAADAAVHQHRHPAVDPVHHPGQRVQGCDARSRPGGRRGWTPRCRRPRRRVRGPRRRRSSRPLTRIGSDVIDRSDGRSAQVSEDRENTSRNVSTAARG